MSEELYTHVYISTTEMAIISRLTGYSVGYMVTGYKISHRLVEKYHNSALASEAN